MPSSANKTLAAKASQAILKARDRATAVGDSLFVRPSELRKLDALWAGRSTTDGSGLLTAVSEWIGKEKTTLDAAWVWLTEASLPGASPQHARSSRLRMLLGNMLASSPNGAELAPKLAPFSNARGFHPLQSIATETGPQILMAVLVSFGFLELADRWLDFVEPHQWDMGWVDAAEAVVRAGRHDDANGADSFLRRLREEQHNRLFAGLPASVAVELSRPARPSKWAVGNGRPDRSWPGPDDDFVHLTDDAEFDEVLDGVLAELSKDGPPGGSAKPPLTPEEKHGVFLATYGSFLLEAWATRSDWIGQTALAALIKIKNGDLATPQQAWTWILEQPLPFDGDRTQPKHGLAQLLVACDHAGMAMGSPAQGLIQKQEAELWPWLETAECFCPEAPLEANGLSMVALALRAPSHVLLAERWVRNMAHELVDAHWTPLAEILSAQDNPAVPTFVATVNRAVEQHALGLAVQEGERTGSAQPFPPDAGSDATISVSRAAPRL